MEILKPVDVVIIGGGWTGLTMAREITKRTPMSVVVLERGPARKLSEYGTAMDEVDYALRFRLMQNIAEETVTHRHNVRDGAVPIRQYGAFLPGTGVGGAGEHWTGFAARHTEEDFRLKTELRERFGAGRLPENLAVEDYPLTYADLEPYYWKVEQMMGVGGKAGNLRGKIVEGGDPFEAPRSEEYPLPPHKQTWAMTIFEKATKELGHHTFPSPAATLTQNYTNPDGISRGACQYCGYCMLYGCMVAAKAQPTNTLLPLLTPKKTFSLKTGSWVRRIVHRDGKAEGVEYMDARGEQVMQPAGLVILSSFTANNSRLLLLSKIGDVYDPATRKGTLGRNFTHTVGGTPGGFVHVDKPLNNYMSAGGQALRFADFEGFRVKPETGLLRGGVGISASTNGGHPIASFGRVPPGETARNWGADWKKAALRNYDRLTSGGSFEMDHMAYAHNFVDLDPTYTDKWGDPLLRITMDWTEHENKQRQFAVEQAMKIAQEMARISGGKFLGADPGGMRQSKRYQTTAYATTHIQGGAIMGSSPESSVVNSWQQHWRVPNLFVVGSSSFPQNSAVHPTLTAVALTLRTADAVVDRYIKRPGVLL